MVIMSMYVVLNFRRVNGTNARATMAGYGKGRKSTSPAEMLSPVAAFCAAASLSGS